MYCSTCGTAVPEGLSYCNRCGASLVIKERVPAPRSNMPLESLVWAIVGVTLGGMGAVIGLMAVMHEILKFSDVLIVAFSILSFLLVVFVDVSLVSLLFRSRAITAEAALRTSELAAGRRDATPMLAEPPASVVEHTTRNFEPAQTKRSAE